MNISLERLLAVCRVWPHLFPASCGTPCFFSTKYVPILKSD